MSRLSPRSIALLAWVFVGVALSANGWRWAGGAPGASTRDAGPRAG